jgi:hypothetical protein
MDDKKELDLEEMESVTGGGNNNTYTNSNKGGKQMTNQGENDNIENSGTINFGD